MRSPDPADVRAIKSVLAGGVLLVAVVTITEVPQPYPTWPTIGSVPVNPELVVPTLLALAVFGGIVADRRSLGIGAAVTGLLGVATCFWGILSLASLYSGGGGGVFWGGFFTLVSGIALAVAVIGREAARAAVRRRGA